MADYTTDLDCVRTFLLKVHTVSTTMHINEAADIINILDASSQRMHVKQPEIIGSGGDDFYWKRYKIEIQEPTEANLITALNNIFIGIKKFNKRTVITDFTYASASTMCHMRFNRSDEVRAIENRIWTCNLWLDVEWSTS